MTGGTDRLDELKAELRSLRPRRPSAGLEARIARELNRPQMLRCAVRHRRWDVPAAVAAMIVLGICLWPRLDLPGPSLRRKAARAWGVSLPAIPSVTLKESSLSPFSLSGDIRQLARQMSLLEREVLGAARAVGSDVGDVAERLRSFAGAIDNFNLKGYAGRASTDEERAER
ncbi:MAG: hypothetical protein WBF17_00230 [Phycisphaerae bacterium]